LVTTHYMDEAERCNDIGYIYLSRMLLLGQPEELKRLPEVTPSGTRWFELDSPESSAQRLGRLQSLAGVHDATLFGDRIHILADESLPPERIVEAAGFAPDETEVRTIGPTLEDVFVALTRQAEQQRAAGESPAAGDDAGLPKTNPTQAEPTQSKPQQESADAAPEAAPDAAISPKPAASVPSGRAFSGLAAIMMKEFAHMRRQPSTLVFLLIVPVIETILFGYALDTQIENIPTIVFDLDGRRQAREFVDAMTNTRKFTIVEHVHDDESYRRALTSGRAKVGVRIPPDYSSKLLARQQVAVEVLIDGSDSQVANSAQNAASRLGLQLSIGQARQVSEAANVAPARDSAGRTDRPIDVRARLLYNPDLKSEFFFVPGLVGIILQLVTVFTTSFAIVREKEWGTLEQLFVTPVSRLGLMLGKLTPYAAAAFVEMLIVLTVMVYVFGVPINGSLALLLALSALFIVCSLALGLLISTIAKTQVAAVLFSFMTMLPAILLSGFVFPRSEMPTEIYYLTFAIPATYFIEILRGIVLRGADLVDLVPWIIGLAFWTGVILSAAVGRFRKQLA
ncbi:MAG: ABC transporter permease, partial [Planctomycetales bacterium]|nr:ABC transporter permease [Planctomycetales bacterium]